MASLSMTSKLSVDDILAFSDEDLVRYIDRHRDPDGDFNLDFEGWDNLPEDRRDQLAERLRFGAQKANSAAQSRPVDLDQVAARLQETSNTTNAASRPQRFERSPTRTPPPAEELMANYHTELVNDGGRPSFPVDIMYQVAQNPEEYFDVLRPWQDWPDTTSPEWAVCPTQYERWQDFRQWQKDNREIRDEDDGFPAFAEARQRLFAIYRRGGPENTGIHNIDTLRRVWNSEQYDRRRNYHWLREGKVYDGFAGYVAAVKNRLAEHGFTRSFQLDEDPNRQDKLTTWIEYLGYEYSWYDRHTRMFKRLQVTHDEAWKKLVDSKMLRPLETAQYLRGNESPMRRQSEKDAAARAVELAKSAAWSTLRWAERARNDPHRSSITKHDRTRRLLAAEARLKAAEESLEKHKRRNDAIGVFFNETRGYSQTERDLKRQGLLVQWILEQVPLIEAELEQSDAGGGSSAAGHGAERRPKRDRDDMVADDRYAKRPRRNSEKSSSLSDGGTASPAQEEGRSEQIPSAEVESEGFEAAGSSIDPARVAKGTSSREEDEVSKD